MLFLRLQVDDVLLVVQLLEEQVPCCYVVHRRVRRNNGIVSICVW